VITYKRLTDKAQTGNAMKKMVNRFSGDLNNFYVNKKPLSKIPLPVFYEIVKNLPYKKDTPGVEIITRPLHLLTSPFKGYDCKKKAVLVAAWLKENNIPFQFIAVSSRQDKMVHHVLIRAQINGQWVEIDPTYKTNQLFESKPWTNAEALTGIKSGSAPVLVELYGNSETLDATIKEFFSFRKYRLKDPEMLGAAAEGVATGAAIVVKIITAVVAAAATVTVAVVAAVQNRKSEQRALQAQREAQEFQLKVYEEQKKEAEKAEQKEESNIAKYGLVGGAILAAVYFLS